MSIETLKEELRQLSRQEQRTLMGFLADLRRENDEHHQQVLEDELNNTDPANWVKWSDLKAELRDLENSCP